MKERERSIPWCNPYFKMVVLCLSPSPFNHFASFVPSARHFLFDSSISALHRKRSFQLQCAVVITLSKVCLWTGDGNSYAHLAQTFTIIEGKTCMENSSGYWLTEKIYLVRFDVITFFFIVFQKEHADWMQKVHLVARCVMWMLRRYRACSSPHDESAIANQAEQKTTTTTAATTKTKPV